jgi:hypothetical protein
MSDGESQREGQPNEDRILGIEEPEEGEGEQSTEPRTTHVHWPPTNAIRERAESGEGQTLDGSAEYYTVQNHTPRQFQLAGGIGDREHGEDVKDLTLRKACAHG